MDTNFEQLLSTYRGELRRIFGIDETAAGSNNLIEHLPLPKSSEALRVSIPAEVHTHHPLSASRHTREVSCTPDQIDAKIREFTDELPSDKRLRYFATWRMLPEKLAELDANLRFFPADFRVPDSTVWHRADAVAAFAAATDNRALLSFNLGPVQPFIEAARSVRDLWTGSAILSWLTFHAMVPVIEAYGPTAMVFPSLRGTPLMDMWLLNECDLRHIPMPEDDARKAPTVPNRFLSLVNAEGVEELAYACESAARAAWMEIAETVKAVIDDQMKKADPTWGRRWKNQIESFFEIRTSVLPLADWDEAKIAQLYGSDSSEGAHLPGEWQSQVELSSQLMDAKRRVRHVPAYNADAEGSDQYPPKCTLLGTYEQLGPDGLDDSAKFWKEISETLTCDGVRLRSQERFSAIATTKRFAAPAYFADKLDLRPVHSMLRFSDTATVSAALWLKEAELDLDSFDGWSGQWLHWSRKDQDPDDDDIPGNVWEAINAARDRVEKAPPTYYAVLQMDGDHMGRWLAGKKTPELSEVYHANVVESFQNSGNADLLEKRRPVTPEYHAAISEALTNFAVRVVPDIVKKHNGVLIYAGGDDVLALLPTRSAIACAEELHDAFSSDYYKMNGDKILLMGSKATVSAGIAVVHYKEDLRIALKAARGAESEAKSAGRDLLRIAALRRSGEHTSATCPWDMATTVRDWMNAFEGGASDRWAYHLRAEMPVLEALEKDAIQAMIRRRVNRADDNTRSKFESIDSQFSCYEEKMHEKRQARRGDTEPATTVRVLEEFITLVQSASFMVRGRDA